MICTGSLTPSTESRALIGVFSRKNGRLNSRRILGGESARLTLPSLHRLSYQLLIEELNNIGFKLEASSRSVEKLYPHLVGHCVGIDLHESDGCRNEE
jgi:intermediate cleaving peptidase 55